jgi:hypothetical protein
MNNESFGELILTTRTNLNGIFKYEWINFKKYAEVHFKYLKIKHLVHPWNGWLMEVILRKNNGAYLEFQNFITKQNLIDFIQASGYDSFVNKIKLKTIKQDSDDDNNDKKLCKNKMTADLELEIDIEI